MKNHIHTVLGANGAIGMAVVRALESKHFQIRRVSTKPNRFRANLLFKEDVDKVISGSAYVYLCIGLPYKASVWQTQWPQIMQNVISACEKYKSKLIFLDNIYMYGTPLPVPFDENTVQTPVSIKERARKQTADLLVNAFESNRIKGLIGRSADFYGKAAKNSFLYISFLERMLKGKQPQVLFKVDKMHTFANVCDIGRALVLLALCDNCYNQVWHLPVNAPIKTSEVLELFNKNLESNFEIKIIPVLIKKVLALFKPIINETKEMERQFSQTYIMNDDKFRKRFPDFKVLSYQDGVNSMVDWFKAN